MRLRILQVLFCAISLGALQGCFVSHSSTVREITPAQTTTVYHEPAGDAVAVSSFASTSSSLLHILLKLTSCSS